MVHHHLEAARTALMESMNISLIPAIALSAVRRLMALVPTARSASTCMAAMGRSVSSAVQPQQVHVHTVHTENTKDNSLLHILPDLFQLAGALYRLKGDAYER